MSIMKMELYLLPAGALGAEEEQDRFRQHLEASQSPAIHRFKLQTSTNIMRSTFRFL